MAFDKLKTKYELNNVSCVVAAKKEFHSRTLKKHENPSEWMMDLAKMRQRLYNLDTGISEEDLMYHVIGNLPMEYRIERKDFEKRLKGKNLNIK